MVFDGIKMGAVVKVNGVVLGNATDQFLRYAWDLHPSTHFLTCGSATNTLEVVFPAQMDVGGRFMACSGGWDWAPCVCRPLLHPLGPGLGVTHSFPLCLTD